MTSSVTAWVRRRYGDGCHWQNRRQAPDRSTAGLLSALNAASQRMCHRRRQIAQHYHHIIGVAGCSSPAHNGLRQVHHQTWLDADAPAPADNQPRSNHSPLPRKFLRKHHHGCSIHPDKATVKINNTRITTANTVVAQTNHTGLTVNDT